MPLSRERERPSKLLDRLESYEQLHLIVVLAGAPGRRWTIAELEQGHDLVDVTVVVEELLAMGVLVRAADGSVALADDPWVREDAAALLREYQDNPLPIIQVLTSRSMERLRSVTARSFADAFVVRRKDS